MKLHPTAGTTFFFVNTAKVLLLNELQSSTANYQIPLFSNHLQCAVFISSQTKILLKDYHLSNLKSMKLSLDHLGFPWTLLSRDKISFLNMHSERLRNETSLILISFSRDRSSNLPYNSSWVIISTLTTKHTHTQILTTSTFQSIVPIIELHSRVGKMALCYKKAYSKRKHIGLTDWFTWVRARWYNDKTTKRHHANSTSVTLWRRCTEFDQIFVTMV